MERKLFFLLQILICLPAVLVLGAGDQDSTLIQQLKEGGRAYAIIGDFDAAEHSFLKILEIDPDNIPARNNLGNVYKYLGRFDEALNVLKEAEQLVIQEQGPDARDLATIYLNIGILYTQKQDYELSLQYLTNSERIIRLNSVTDIISSAIYNNIGNVYFGMREWRKALKAFQQGLDIKESNRHPRIHVSYTNVASAYENLNVLDSARIFYQRSIQSKKRVFNDTAYQLISVYGSYGVLLQKMGEHDLAKEYFDEALAFARIWYPEKHPIVSSCHHHLGGWNLTIGNNQEALNEFHAAVRSAVFDFDLNDPYSNPSLDNDIISYPVLMNALYGKAEALLSLYHEHKDVGALKTCLQSLEVANLLAAKMRSTYQGQESKLFITEFSHSGFDKAIDVAYELYRITGDPEYANKAFIFAEKSKSSVLLSLLQEVERKNNLGIPEKILNREQDLKNESEFYKKLLYEEKQRAQPDSSKLGIWQGKLLILSQQLDSISRMIRERYPQYASKYDNEVADLNQTMDMIDAGSNLIEYSLTDSSLYIFVIGAEEFHCNRLLLDSTFFSNVHIIGAFLRNNDFNNNTSQDFRQYTRAAYDLYTILIGNVEKTFNSEKLIIVPDGELGYIPFEALLSELPGDKRMDYRDLAYLIYDYQISYSYSSTLLFAESDKRQQAGKKLLAFAPTYEHMEEISSDKFPSYRNYSSYLVPLKYISDEIRNINEIIKGDLFEGFEATEAVFKSKAPDYDILHLAMHTLINDENPMYSQLVFTLNNDTLEANDGLLNTYEIFNMDLSARMAVLSACNTGYGKLRKGEGIMSLARGFIYAGVPSIIMTLWAVEDQSGSVLMSSFYENLVDGQEIDAALREAKLQYLAGADQLSAHPYLWSGYVCIGATSPIVSGGTLLLYVFAGLGVLIAVLAVFILRRRKTRRA